MYVRPQNYRYPSGVTLPDNYGGSAFRESPLEDEAPQSAPPPALPDEDNEPTRALLSHSEHGAEHKPECHEGIKGIGSEELLLLALIILLNEGENSSELILLLALLLFIK